MTLNLVVCVQALAHVRAGQDRMGWQPSSLLNGPAMEPYSTVLHIRTPFDPRNDGHYVPSCSLVVGSSSLAVVKDTSFASMEKVGWRGSVVSLPHDPGLAQHVLNSVVLSARLPLSSYHHPWLRLLKEKAIKVNKMGDINVS